MSRSNYSNRKCFTFIWILENFEYCEQGTEESLDSPKFIVDTIERTKWSLSIYPRGEKSERWISVYLSRETDSKGPASIEVDYELALLASDGSVLISKSEYNCEYSDDERSGFEEFAERKSIFSSRSSFLPQGALTMRCKIWKSIGEVKRDGYCIARTRIGVERKAFLWKIKKFSSYDKGRKITFMLKSTSNDEQIMTLTLFIRKFRKFKDICITFVNSDDSIGFSTFKSFIVDAMSDYVNVGDHEFWFSPTDQTKNITLSLSKNKLMKHSYLYLPNDVLTLYCEKVFSTGVVLEGIEGTSYGCSGTFITTNVISENKKSDNCEKLDSETPSALKMDLSSMLQDNILCDVKLCAESEMFPAHWFILNARSPVFRAMFKSDMKEKTNDRIDIVDLKPDTVRRMLLYMYTDDLDELQWETASDLYVAAEKYQIMTLKNKCSSFLKTNLNLTNVCEVLLLADLHQDKELKTSVQDFILENDKDIINSNEWKLLMQANVNLAAETMLLRFKE